MVFETKYYLTFQTSYFRQLKHRLDIIKKKKQQQQNT